MRTELIEWHFESGLKRIPYNTKRLTIKLTQWEKNRFLRDSPTHDWISEGLGKNTQEITQNCINLAVGDSVLASFLFIAPFILSVDELRKIYGTQIDHDLLDALKSLTKSIITTFLEPHYPFSYLIRTSQKGHQFYMFSSVVFAGSVWWKSDFSPPASHYPKQKDFNWRIEEKSSEIVKQIFPSEVLRSKRKYWR
jgi:hypothetical protein